MRHPLEVLARRLLEHEIGVPGKAAVDMLPHITDAPVASRILAANVGRGIRRGVVGNDELEVLVGLGKDRLYALPDIILAIKHWQTDAHSWHYSLQLRQFNGSRRP